MIHMAHAPLLYTVADLSNLHEFLSIRTTPKIVETKMQAPLAAERAGIQTVRPPPSAWRSKAQAAARWLYSPKPRVKSVVEVGFNLVGSDHGSQCRMAVPEFVQSS